MPEVAALGDLWQVKMVGRQEGQTTNNIFDFAVVGASSDVLVHLVQVFAECFITNLLPVLSSSWALESFTYKRTNPTLGPEFTYIPTGTLTGGGNAAALPTTVAAVFSKLSSQGGKSKRGRFYICGVPEAATINSQLDTSHAFWIAAVAFCACLASNFFHPDPAGGSDLFDIGIYSRKIGGATFPYNDSGFVAASSIVPKQVLGTMRSRKIGRGI
jgi:hypothetical protein